MADQEPVGELQADLLLSIPLRRSDDGHGSQLPVARLKRKWAQHEAEPALIV